MTRKAFFCVCLTVFAGWPDDAAAGPSGQAVKVTWSAWAETVILLVVEPPVILFVKLHCIWLGLEPPPLLAVL